MDKRLATTQTNNNDDDKTVRFKATVSCCCCYSRTISTTIEITIEKVNNNDTSKQHFDNFPFRSIILFVEFWCLVFFSASTLKFKLWTNIYKYASFSSFFLVDKLFYLVVKCGIDLHQSGRVPYFFLFRLVVEMTHQQNASQFWWNKCDLKNVHTQIHSYIRSIASWKKIAI